jgi:hypothetical protein
MATRRVKRIKRSKKHVHRARGRKTNHRRRRHTRRQTGGALITVCKKKGLFEAVASGIDITYDVETHMFKIGTQPTITDLETFNGKKRYERAVWILKLIGQSNQLNWYNFALFAPLYCHEYTDPQCEEIREFVDKYSKSEIVDKNGAVESRTIATSIKSGLEQSERQSYKPQIVARFGKAPAVSGAAADDSAVPEVVSNTLKVTTNYIAYRGHTRIVETFPTVKSTREYKFKNFTIPLNDRVITGVLDVNFVTDSISKAFTTKFSLSLNLNVRDELFQCISECLGKKTINDAVTITTIKKTMMGGMQINGTLSEKKVGTTTSTYDFNDFVMKFAECHNECLDAKLAAQMADLSVAEPTKESITSTLNTTVEYIETLMRNIAYKQKNVKDPAKLAALTQISAEAGPLQMLYNQLTRTLMEPQEQAQLVAINLQASELFHKVRKLLAQCDHITSS